MKKLLLLLVFFSLFSGAFAVIGTDAMKLFAVTTSGEAVSARLIVDIEPGTGRVWTDVTPLVGTTTQSAEKTAVSVASAYFPDAKQFDYKFDIESNASIVEGPSAGAAMALIVVSMLRGEPFNQQVSITGTISESGKVGPVGGVFEKAKQAAKEGIKLFMIPKGEAKQTIRENNEVKTVNLVNYAFQNWGLKVVEVGDLDEVLLLASQDIGELDVNATGITEIKEFSPVPIASPSFLEPMKSITRDILGEAHVRTEEAKTAVSGTFISDEIVIDYLLQTLNSAEKTLKEGQIQFDNNYLYSAANSSFIALVYVSLVKDIADNPSLLQEGSKAFELRLENLDKRISSLKEDLDASVPIDSLEWHIAAKQRLSWAELNYFKLTSTQTIVIGSEGIINDGTINVLKKIEDLEFAIAWVSAAENFFRQTKNSKKRVLMDDHFSNYFSDYIVNIENNIPAFPPEETEDIQRRLDAARLEEQNSWFLAATFDSASSYALINAMGKLKDLGDDTEALHALLKEKVESLQNEFTASGGEAVWARLYLDHAAYFLKAAEFYEEEGYSIRAMENLKSGINLAFLAAELFKVSGDIKEHYSAFGPEDFLKQQPGGKETPLLSELSFLDLVYLAMLLCVLAILLLLVVLLSRKVIRTRHLQHLSLEEQLGQMNKLKQKIDTAFAEGKISEEKHSEFVRKYDEQITFLRKEIADRSKELIQIDRLRADLASYQAVLRDLKKQFQQKKVLESDYRKSLAEFKGKISETRSALDQEAGRLKSEKQKATTKTLSFAAEEKLLEKKPKQKKKTIAAKPRSKKLLPALIPKPKVKGTETKTQTKPKGTNSGKTRVKGA